jgi:DNA-damage-inducible protein J
LLFNDLGLDVPSAVRLFLKQSLIHNGIPFAIAGTDGFYSDYNLQSIKKSIQQLEQGKIVTKTMEELETMADE